jgi:inosine-uridine nucleoside N-ribohydrolase
MHSVLMDVDTGIDDALALVYLLSRPDVRVQAITCTAGNVGARQVALNNLALLELCGRPGIEVAIGCEEQMEITLVNR